MSDDFTTRRTVLKSITAGVGVTIAGCTGNAPRGGGAGGGGSGSSGSGSGGPQGNSSSKDSRLFRRITSAHYPTMPYSVPFAIAERKKYYSKYGLKPPKEILGSSGGGTTLRNLTSGNLAWGGIATSAIIQGYTSGAPVQLLGATSSTASNLVWMISGEKQFENLTDAKGMSIGYTSPGSATQTLSALVISQTDGIKLDDVELKGLGGISENITALKQGNVDIGVVLPALMPQLKPDFKVAFTPFEYVGGFLQGSMGASTRTIKENPEELRRFIKAYDDANQFLQQAQSDDTKFQEAVTAYASINNFGKPRAERELAFIRENGGLNEFYGVSLSNHGLALVAEGMNNVGTYEGDVPWKEIVDQSLLPKARRINLNPSL